jgi:predicted glycoside hydrolase/deacetylase ChbG (UPF0249 family)
MTRNIRENFIVTADDYGIRQTAEPILRLAHEGKVDRVAVLIHYVSPDQAQALLRSGVKIDLHLELIGLLKSGTKVRENPVSRGLNFCFRYYLGFLSEKRVRQEWQTQIERFQELFGRVPDGLNSHEHLHFFPKFSRVFVELAKQHHISFLRFGRKGILLPQNFTLTGKILDMLWKRARHLYSDTTWETSEYVVSLDWLLDFDAFSRQLPEGTIELVVHPEREEDYRTLLEYF